MSSLPIVLYSLSPEIREMEPNVVSELVDELALFLELPHALDVITTREFLRLKTCVLCVESRHENQHSLASHKNKKRASVYIVRIAPHTAEKSCPEE